MLILKKEWKQVSIPFFWNFCFFKSLGAIFTPWNGLEYEYVIEKVQVLSSTNNSFIYFPQGHGSNLTLCLLLKREAIAKDPYSFSVLG